ncbi:MAG: OmpA family protein [Bacteroidales bacterium]|nr:OmpA family protein [Bacteroidales bacterium]
MKKRSLLLLIVLCLPFAFAMKAQDNPLSIEKQYPNDETAYTVYNMYEHTQLDSSATAVRTSWVANRPKDNWFISVNGGVGQLMSEETRYMDFKDQLTPTFGFAFGKWFSPVWGLRISATAAELQGFAIWSTQDGTGEGFGTWYVGQNHPKPFHTNLSNDYIPAFKMDGENNAAGRQLIFDRFLKDGEYIQTGHGPGYTHKITYIGASIDFMVNLKNLFTTYNPDAFFNPVVYAGLGWAHTLKDGDRTAVNSMMAKGGLQLGFRLSDRWQIFLDGQLLMLPEIFDRRVGGDMTQDFVGNYTLGLSYRFNFRHFIKTPVIQPCDMDHLNQIINDLRNRPEVICPPLVICPEPEVEREMLTPVFFTLDSYVVRDNQLISIAKAAQYLINHPNARIQIAGYADKNTGNPKHNMKLSENRSKAVADVLVNRFGIERSRLQITYFGDTVQPFDENDWNRVAIFIVP